MSSFPFGIREVDVTVLLQASDQELGRLCQSSTYLNQLCQDDHFWKLRLEQRAPQLLPLRRYFSSYYELYQSSGYLAYGLQFGNVDADLTLYNDIHAAYQRLLELITASTGIQELPPIERADELLNVFATERSPIRIYLMGLGEIYPSESRHTLIDLSAPQIILSSNLDSLPVFTPKVFVTYNLENPSMIEVSELSGRSLERLNSMSQSQRLVEDTFTIQRSDNQESLNFSV